MNVNRYTMSQLPKDWTNMHQIHQTSMLELLYAGSEWHNSSGDSTDEKKQQVKGKTFCQDNLCTCKLISFTCGENERKLYELLRNEFTFRTKNMEGKKLTKKNLIKKYSFMHFGDAARAQRRQTEVHLKRISFKWNCLSRQMCGSKNTVLFRFSAQME